MTDTGRGERWRAVAGEADRHELRTDRAGVVTLEEGSGVWWLRTPGDPHGCRATNLGPGSVRTAKARARAELTRRDDDEAERRRGWVRVR